jgi:hypothetical protein
MSTSKAKLSATTTTKLGLATAIATLWMTAILNAGAVAEGTSRQLSAGRAGPFTSAASWPHDFRNMTGATTKFISIGPVWPDMASRNDRQSGSKN